MCASVRGGDFTSTGAERLLDWFEAKVAKQYEIIISPRNGLGPGDEKTAP